MLCVLQGRLLIVPEGIEIVVILMHGATANILLIVPEGIEMKVI